MNTNDYLSYDKYAGGYDADGNYYLYDDMEASHE